MLGLDRQDDELLAREVGQGEPDAFEVLAARWRPLLQRYCSRRMRSRDDADDVVQDIMERAYRRLLRGGEIPPLRPLMFTIARNACIDRLRARGRVSEVLLEDESRDPRPTPPERLAQREELDATIRDVARLSERQRCALLLREMWGLSYEEIGGELEVTPAQAKSLISEARQVLAERRAGRELDCHTFALLLAQARHPHRSHRLQAHVEGCSRCKLPPLMPKPVLVAAPVLAFGRLARWGGHARRVPVAIGAAPRLMALVAAVAAGAGVTAMVRLPGPQQPPTLITAPNAAAGHALLTSMVLRVPRGQWQRLVIYDAALRASSMTGRGPGAQAGLPLARGARTRRGPVGSVLATVAASLPRQPILAVHRVIDRTLRVTRSITTTTGVALSAPSAGRRVRHAIRKLRSALHGVAVPIFEGIRRGGLRHSGHGDGRGRGHQDGPGSVGEGVIHASGRARLGSRSRRARDPSRGGGRGSHARSHSDDAPPRTPSRPGPPHSQGQAQDAGRPGRSRR